MPAFLLKLSGEVLGGDAGFGVEPAVLQQLAADVKELTEQGVALALVLGGGNLFRGQNLAESGMDRVVGDRMGMLATVMNGLAMGDFLSQAGVPNKLFSSMEIPGVAQGYHRDEVRDLMQQGVVCILSGGTGNPFFTTDTAACLRGVELNVDAVLKATNVDGVYDADPKSNAQARKFDTVSYDEVLQRQLGVMDLTAIILCKDNAMPLIVFDMMAKNVLQDIAAGKVIGTRVVA